MATVHRAMAAVFLSAALLFLGGLGLVVGFAEGDKMASVCSSFQFDYKDALTKAILFFEGQRSGRLPGDQRVKWRGNSALSDGKLENVDLVGGYYDAGDNVKFGWPMAFTTSLLSWAAVERAPQISSAQQTEDLLAAIRWGTDFLLKAHTGPTTLYTQVGDGYSDHNCWERPEDMDTPRVLFKITASSPGSEAAADASAALASASIAFKTANSGYSSKLLAASKSLFAFADKYRGSYQASCPFYCSYSGYQDELLWAAAWLYKATGETQYLDYVTINQGWSQQTSEFSWDNKFAGVQVLLAKEYLAAGKKALARFKSDADAFMCSMTPGSGSTRVQTTPGGLLYTRDSANLQYASGAALLLLYHSAALQQSGDRSVRCGNTDIPTSNLTAFAKAQVDYVLGQNPRKFSYMAGFGSTYSRRIHHRAASIPAVAAHPARVGCKDGFSSWYSTGDPNPNDHVGAVVGGPGQDDGFIDDRTNSARLEPATYMNAAFVGALAGVMATVKGDVGCGGTMLKPVGDSASEMASDR